MPTMMTIADTVNSEISNNTALGRFTNCGMLSPATRKYIGVRKKARKVD